MRSSYCFSVHAVADPSTLPRVTEVLSVYGMVPRRCHSQCGSDADLVIDIQVDGLDVAQAAAVAQRMGRIVTVDSVLWSEKVQRHAA